MKTLRLVSVLLAIVILSACAAPTLADVEQAQKTLITFFDHLNRGEYTEADILYGGSYEVLIDYNPSVNPNDRVTLWQHACTLNGMQCLSVRSTTFKAQNGDEFTFTVEFNDPNGGLFVFGPCCGATETEMPPVSKFEYRVTKATGGQFKVMDLPIYVP